ncbi:putative ankyrin repeat protein RF_0381 [Daphnia carinata]|uniref:putative ankyrin repeat protein RF_0381 n=1 Tax=Daphnia carinata TaxID=120202 RepID=UPI00257983BE|nr:putative ankyrin repeat protein RF_0381 [Daphnia carinata]
MSSSTAFRVNGIRFHRHDFLGSGGFGSVFCGTYEGRRAPAKRIEKKNDEDQVVDNELKILEQLDHPNIVKFFHCVSDADFNYFALDLCDASLDQVFLNEDDPRKYKGPELPNNFEIFSQLATGLNYIHSKRQIHRNIKPENILISVKHTNHAEGITIKWADFRLPREMNERGTFTMSGIKGTQHWFAPEVMEMMGRNLRIEKTKESSKSDIYAEGLVFGYILLKGRHPYGNSDLEIVRNIMNQNPVNMSEISHKHLARNLIEKMLAMTPDTRITSEDVVTQLHSIKIKLTEAEENLHRLCADQCQKIEFRILGKRIWGFQNDIVDEIISLMQLGIDINARNKKGWNALHLLCHNYSGPTLIDAIKLLIELGIDKDAKDNDGCNALHLLCFNNSSPSLIDAIKLLIELGIDKNAKKKDGCNVLHLLCCNNSSPLLIDAIKLLIQLGIDKNAQKNNGWNALHLLCFHNSSPHLIDAIKFLIHFGIDKDAKDYDGWNALHLLCFNNSSPHIMDAIKLLIELGIDIDAKTNAGSNALHLLCCNNSSPHLIDAIKLLIEIGIDTNAKKNDGWNALHVLCYNNSSPHLMDAIKILIKLGIDKDAKISDGSNALHVLYFYNSSPHKIDAINLLIELGIDKSVKRSDGSNTSNNSSSHLTNAIKPSINLGIEKKTKKND